MVAVVFDATALVGIGNDTEGLPAATNTDAGGVTAGELLESETDAPPGGAWPDNITIPPGCAPPVIVDGEIESDFNEVGATVIWPDADFPFSVAVIVTTVGATTWPACIWNCIQAELPII